MRGPRSSTGLLRYAAGWLLGGAVAALILLMVLENGEERVLPPLQQVEAGTAARAARCQMRSAALPDRDPSRPVAAGIYEEPVSEGGTLAALRRGLVVITYLPTLGEADRDRLVALQKVVPRGTVLAPAPTTVDGPVRVRASRVELRCPRADSRVVDAVRLFRGRYIGRRP